MQALTINYRAVTLVWQPGGGKNEQSFRLITLIVFSLVALLAVYITSVELPKSERKRVVSVPDRVAQYISERPKPPPPKPQVKPIPPPPPKVKPKVMRKPQTETKKVLSKTEKKARQKASETGLLALASELSDLIDTSDIDALVNTKVRKNISGSKVSNLGTAALTAGVGEGVASVDTNAHLGAVGNTKLSSREIAQVKKSLFKVNGGEIASAKKEKSERGENLRSEEDISIVFDQNKGVLYSIYNRERRKNVSLRGKIVFQLTIAPSGKVLSAKVLSSELNDSSLERRLLARVKNFNFGARAVEKVTVTFPVEFLP